MSTRLPMTRFTSTRCRPQFASTLPVRPMSPTMSSTRGSEGLPFTVTSRYPLAFSFDVHFAVRSPGALTHGVSIGCSGVTHGFGGIVLVMVLPLLSRYACSSPLPPPSAAGFVHAATMVGSATRPNIVLAGGGIVDLYEA